MTDTVKILQQAVTCTTGSDPNCSECCAIFTNEARRAAFGYQATSATCECHDICVKDVRDICVKRRTIRQCVPCNINGQAGCRGGFLPEGVPSIHSWRVLCADESISPETNCDRINNDVEFEVILRYGANTLVVITPRETFSCLFYEFARFPSGVFYPRSTTGLDQFRSELAQIDGSCKVIIVESVTVTEEGNNCVLAINYKVIDKLWKHENLLVSAIKPYTDNITVCQTFEQGHFIGPCTGEDPCSGSSAG